MDGYTNALEQELARVRRELEITRKLVRKLVTDSACERTVREEAMRLLNGAGEQGLRTASYL